MNEFEIAGKLTIAIQVVLVIVAWFLLYRKKAKVWTYFVSLFPGAGLVIALCYDGSWRNGATESLSNGSVEKSEPRAAGNWFVSFAQKLINAMPYLVAIGIVRDISNCICIWLDLKEMPQSLAAALPIVDMIVYCSVFLALYEWFKNKKIGEYGITKMIFWLYLIIMGFMFVKYIVSNSALNGNLDYDTAYDLIFLLLSVTLCFSLPRSLCGIMLGVVLMKDRVKKINAFFIFSCILYFAVPLFMECCDVVAVVSPDSYKNLLDLGVMTVFRVASSIVGVLFLASCYVLTKSKRR